MHKNKSSVRILKPALLPWFKLLLLHAYLAGIAVDECLIIRECDFLSRNLGGQKFGGLEVMVHFAGRHCRIRVIKLKLYYKNPRYKKYHPLRLSSLKGFIGVTIRTVRLVGRLQCYWFDKGKTIICPCWKQKGTLDGSKAVR